MKKFLVLLILLFPLSVFALDLHSEKYVIYNLDDDEIILEKGISDDVMIASLTKILSAMVIIDGCDNLDKKVVYTREMENSIPLHAYVIRLKEGVEYTYSDLLYATILPSAADAPRNAGALHPGHPRLHEQRLHPVRTLRQVRARPLLGDAVLSAGPEELLLPPPVSGNARLA